MIDCHTHVFPTPHDYVERLHPTLRTLTEEHIVPRARGLMDILYKHVPAMAPTLPIDVESLARMRQYKDKRVVDMAESVGSTVLMPQALLGGTFAHLKEAMRESGVRKSVVIAAPPFAPNDWLLSSVLQEGGDQFVPVATVPQTAKKRTHDEWCHEFDVLADLGACGFKIYPSEDKLPAKHVAYLALFEVARARKLFVIMHTGCFSSPFKRHHDADPRAFAKHFERFKDVPVCLAHMNRDDPDVVFALMKKYERLYTDTSWQPAAAIRRALKEVGKERMLLGSDWPLLHTGVQKESIAILRRATTVGEFEAITSDNAERFLGKE
jgi:predicted TIM-barrel fold metal-dependent hydrolase